jgi:hypothetical protein
MDYTIERDGGGTRLLLENGDRITIKIVVGHIKESDRELDSSREYNVQTAIAMFVDESEMVKEK